MQLKDVSVLSGRHEPGLGTDSSEVGQDGPRVSSAVTASSAPAGRCCVQTGIHKPAYV